jgi:ribosome biogenesis GTPase A
MRVKYSFSSRRTGHIENIRKQRSKYPDVAESVIRMSDIILEVLDARFIEETRNKEIEKQIKGKGKEIIFILNKADLINKEEALISSDVYPYIFVSTKDRAGGGKLRNLIKIEASKFLRREKGRKNVYIGVLGYPNVGKSSLINLLTGKAGARVGDEPGFTKGLQKLRLSRGLLLIDTPGVIPKREYSMQDSKLIEKHAKVGARSYANVRDPEMAVANLMNQYSEEIEKFYGITAEGNSELLIEEFGKRKNLMKRGGEVDFDRASRLILKDWQEGKIKFKPKFYPDEESLREREERLEKEDSETPEEERINYEKFCKEKDREKKERKERGIGG